MDGAPLNLAHFHERRADKFLKRHHYDQAQIAMENALFHLQRSYENVKMCKSLEVLQTHRWEYERKLRQIKMRKHEYETSKKKENSHLTIIKNITIIPPGDAQAQATTLASINKTVQKFDKLQQCSGDNHKPLTYLNRVDAVGDRANKENLSQDFKRNIDGLKENDDDDDDVPCLDPLELPTFDYSFLPTELAEKFQKLN